MKKICIIWAGSWIGKALAEYYTQVWNHVDMIARQDIDVQKQDQRDLLRQKVIHWKYDIVIYSAGVWYHKHFSELSQDEIYSQILVNTLAPLQILSCIWKTTVFVYLSSIVQYIPTKNMSVYAASKRAMSQTLAAVQIENSEIQTLCIDLWAVKTDMHLKAGLTKRVGKDLEKVIPRLVKAIETSRGTKTLFWDWWMTIYIVFPIYRLFLICKNIWNKF